MRCQPSQALEIPGDGASRAVAKWDSPRQHGTSARVGRQRRSKMEKHFRGATRTPMTELRWILLDREGRVRSGWAVLVFVVATVAVGVLLALVGPLFKIGPMLGNWLLLIASLAGTAVGCLVVRHPFVAAGFRDPRWWERVLV